MKVLVTGANGFVGAPLCMQLDKIGFEVLAACRKYSSAQQLGSSIKSYIIGDLKNPIDWAEALTGIDTVVHCAARVHLVKDRSANPLEEFRKVNVAATMHLAQQAIAAGCKRFIYLSSIKVNGEETQSQAFTADSKPAPKDAYAQSKSEAETKLLKLAQQNGMEVVIIRPPLVYGKGVKANFNTMARVAALQIPLPFAGIDNKRSLVSLDNLIDFILHCITHPAAAGQIFLVSDGADYSIGELLRELAMAQNKRLYLFYAPKVLLTAVACLLGRKKMLQRIVGSLQVDIKKNEDVLGWKPKYTLAQSLEKMFVK